MLVRWFVTVVLLDDWIKELSEGGVRVVRTGVDTDAGIEVLDSREDAGPERDTGSIGLVLILLPDCLGQVLGQRGLCAFWEERFKVLELISTVELPWAEALASWGSLRRRVIGRWLLLHTGAGGALSSSSLVLDHSD